MKKKTLALGKVYQLLEPGPVVLLTTARKSGPNVMAMSWHMMMEFEPPLVGCIVSNRNYSFTALKKTGECVINVPTVELAQEVVDCGNSTGREIDKFETFGLTAVPASQVGAPLIAECYANLECKVVDTTLVSKYNFFVLEVVKAWIAVSAKLPKTIHHHGYGTFVVDGRRIKLPSRMK